MVEADVGALRPDDRSWEVQERRETRSGWRLRVGPATTLFHTKSPRTIYLPIPIRTIATLRQQFDRPCCASDNKPVQAGEMPFYRH